MTHTVLVIAGLIALAELLDKLHQWRGAAPIPFPSGVTKGGHFWLLAFVLIAYGSLVFAVWRAW